MIWEQIILSWSVCDFFIKYMDILILAELYRSGVSFHVQYQLIKKYFPSC